MKMTEEQKELERQKLKEKKEQEEKQKRQKKEQEEKQRKIIFEELKQNRSNELNQLEDWTGLQCNDLLFDSNIHDWSKNNSDFSSRIKGHRNVCILIEDTNGNIFGGYCSKEIGIDKYHFDSKSFVFSLQING